MGLMNPKPSATPGKNAGGGKPTATAAPINTAEPGTPGNQTATAAPAAGTKPTKAPAAGTKPTKAPAQANGTVIQLKGAQQGATVSRAKLQVTLAQLKVTGKQTSISLQVSGLPKNYQPVGGFGDPTIVLTNGKVLKITQSQGGGGQGMEIAQYTFPALPAGTKTFFLMVPNSWTGKIETWKIPVTVTP